MLFEFAFLFVGFGLWLGNLTFWSRLFILFLYPLLAEQVEFKNPFLGGHFSEFILNETFRKGSFPAFVLRLSIIDYQDCILKLPTLEGILLLINLYFFLPSDLQIAQAIPSFLFVLARPLLISILILDIFFQFVHQIFSLRLHFLFLNSKISFVWTSFLFHRHHSLPPSMQFTQHTVIKAPRLPSNRFPITFQRPMLRLDSTSTILISLGLDGLLYVHQVLPYCIYFILVAHIVLRFARVQLERQQAFRTFFVLSDLGEDLAEVLSLPEHSIMVGSVHGQRLQQSQNQEHIHMMDVKANPDSRQSQPKRKSSAAPRRPISESANLDEPCDFDASKYRILIHCFSTNLSQYYGKRHKDLLGELEELYKITLSREEKGVMEDGVEGIVEKYAGKLMRDVLLRNGAIARSINEYAEAYPRPQKPPQPTPDNIQTLQLPENPPPQPLHKQSPEKPATKQRPHSSTRTTHKQFLQNLSSINKGAIFKNRPSRADNHEYLEYGIATENQEAGCFVFIRDGCRKGGNKAKFHGRYQKNSQGVTLFSQYQAEKNSYLRLGDENKMANGQSNYNYHYEFYQSEKFVGNRSRQSSNRVTAKIISRQSKESDYAEEKCMAKTNINKFFNMGQNWSTRQKSIDQLDREKIQNRILSMNGVPSANVVKPQGYKPKSKCWGTAVSLAGKLSEPHEVRQAKSLFSMIKYK